MKDEINCLIINPPRVNGMLLTRESICVGVSAETQNPLLLYSLAETLKKFTSIENVIPINLSIQEMNMEHFKNYDYIILINNVFDYRYNKDWTEKFLSDFPGKKIVVLTPNVPIKNYTYNNAITVGGIFPEQEVLKLFSDQKISYDEIPISVYDRSIYKKIWIDSGRGCTYSCLYCGQSRDKLMLKSAETLFEEIKLINKQGVKYAYFLENEFTINKKRVIKFCEYLINSGIRFKWGCQTRIDLVDEDLLSLMSKAGCKQISYGIESVNPETQKIIRKNLDIDKAKRIIGITKKYMMVSLYFIVGLPNETEQTILKQLDFVKEVRPDAACVFPIYTEPGTEFHNLCLKNKWLNDEDGSTCKGYSCFHEECAVSYPHLSSDRILELTRFLRDQINQALKYDIIRFLRRVKWRFIYSEKSRIEILKNRLGI